MLRRYWIVALCVLLASCRPVREPAPPAPAVPAPAIPSTLPRWTIDPAQSEIRILVYRDGPMQRLGHNHVITVRPAGDVFLGDDPTAAVVSLHFRVADMEVDRAEARAAEGADFVVQPDAAAIDGTRGNMLGEKLLDTAQFPEIRVDARVVSGTEPGYELAANVTIRGATWPITIPVTVERGGERLTATGEFTVTHAQLGLTPFSVMGGMLAVRDELRVRATIAAHFAGRQP